MDDRTMTESPAEAGRLSTRVIELRKRRGLTLEQLAAASGVSRSMLSQIERGKANPTLAVTLRIAQAFDIRRPGGPALDRLAHRGGAWR